MPEVDIPPPSSTLDHYRAEVERRARDLGLRRRRRTAGALAAAVAVVVVAVSVGTVDQPAPLRTATGSSAATHAGAGLPRAASRPTAALPAPVASNQATGAVNGTPDFAPSGSTDSVTIDERPSGFVATTGVDRDVLIILADPTGGFGRTEIARGSTTVVSLVSQSWAGGTVRIVVRTNRPGRASFSVPYPGRPAASWHGTIVVTGGR